TRLLRHGLFVHRSREAPAPAAGEHPGFRARVAEGATAPESLRQKDRVGGRTLWKADGASRPTEGVSARGTRARPRSQVSRQRGCRWKMPASGVAGPCRELLQWAKRPKPNLPPCLSM